MNDHGTMPIEIANTALCVKQLSLPTAHDSGIVACKLCGHAYKRTSQGGWEVMTLDSLDLIFRCYSMEMLIWVRGYLEEKIKCL